MKEFNIKSLGTKKCPKCGFVNIATVKYCGECNTRLVKIGENSCPKCGLKVDKNDIKCPNCGMNLKNKNIKKLIVTILEIMIILAVGIFVIKYGSGKYKWIYRFILVVLGASVLMVNTKEYHKIVEYEEDPDPVVDQLQTEIYDMKMKRKKK